MKTKTRSKKQSPSLHIRWMIRRDMPEVLAIEQSAFEYPWSEDDFKDALRHRNTVSMVAENDHGRIVGLYAYVFTPQRLDVINLAVHSRHRRNGIGRAMLDKLKSKLSREYHNMLIIDVREFNLGGQLFLKSQGFVCDATMRNHYAVTDEDAYRFVFRHGWD